MQTKLTIYLLLMPATSCLEIFIGVFLFTVLYAAILHIVYLRHSLFN